MAYFLNDPEYPERINLLMRLTDDYIFFTNYRPNGQTLLKELLIASETYGFKINDKKITANF